MNEVIRYLRRVVATDTRTESDAALLARFVAGRDEEAFSALVLRHAEMVHRVCRGVLRHEQDSEDACQATFLVLAQQALHIRRSASLACWLHGVALRTCYKARARAARRWRDAGSPLPSRRADPTDDVTLREAGQILHEELARLPDRYRAPLVLCYLEDRTHDEAATSLGWSLTAFRGRLDRARRRLRQRLERRGLTLSAVLFATAFGASGSRIIAASIARSASRVAAVGIEQAAVHGTVSPPVYQLTREVLGTMAISSFKLTAAVFVSVALAAFGYGGWVRSPRVETPASAAESARHAGLDSSGPSATLTAALVADDKQPPRETAAGAAVDSLVRNYRRLFEVYEQISILRAQREAYGEQIRVRFAGLKARRLGYTLEILREAERFWADALVREYANIVLYQNALTAFEAARDALLRQHHVVLRVAPPKPKQPKIIVPDLERLLQDLSLDTAELAELQAEMQKALDNCPDLKTINPAPLPDLTPADVAKLHAELEQVEKGWQQAREKWPQPYLNGIPCDAAELGRWLLQFRRGRLGVDVESPSPALIAQLGLPRDQGMVVIQVGPDSAAASAGVKAYDILLEVDGKAVSSDARVFVQQVRGLAVDMPVNLVVLRKGKRETLKGLSFPTEGR